jgi:hypothetical protein
VEKSTLIMHTLIFENSFPLIVARVFPHLSPRMSCSGVQLRTIIPLVKVGTEEFGPTKLIWP